MRRRLVRQLYLLLALALSASCAGSLGSDGSGSPGPGGTNGNGGGNGTGSGNGSGGDTNVGGGDGAGTGGGAGSGGGGGSGVGGGTVTPAPPSAPLKLPGLVAYWGQNGFGGANPADATRYEKDLASTCTQHPEYDIVVLAFVTSFVRTRNADGYPEMNFANHCDTPWDARNPFLLKCPDIATGIETCHAKGKRVLLSLGGASGSYGFVSDDEARTFAKTTWDMFLGGTSAVRPFGAAVLDGVDLDLEGGSPTGYSAFVKSLRTIMDAASSSSGARKFYIAAAPQCPFPDAYLGPAAGKALGDAPTAFDFLFVQFYNNFCAGTSPSAFTDAWTHWAGVGPKIFVGLPATTQAANAASYVDRTALPSLLNGVKGAAAFGGVMLWDVSFDQNSTVIDGKTYGAAARALY